jgi:hypothetical protein
MINLSRDDLKLTFKYTKTASIGGISHIHKNKSDRLKKLNVDNFIGQIGTLAGCIALLGEEEGRLEYIKARTLADKNPLSGDKGQDIVGLNIDIKCSLMRKSKNPLSYNFLIRKREIHKDWLYLQTLAEKYKKDDLSEGVRVHIMGWAKTEDIPKKPESFGPLEGAYKIPVSSLRKLPIENLKSQIQRNTNIITV